jgi:hypothetical protein
MGYPCLPYMDRIIESRKEKGSGFYNKNLDFTKYKA